MKNKKGNTAVIAVIVVIVAITAGVIGYLFAKKSQAPVAAQPVAVAPSTMPIAQTQPITSATQEVAQQTTVYRNDQFGFQVTLPKGWENYRALVSGNSDSSDIFFDLPTTDKSYSSSADDHKIGFQTMFSISVESYVEYNKEQALNCSGGGSPACTGVKISDIKEKNGKYVFLFSRTQELPASDIAKFVDDNNYVEEISATFEPLN